MSDWVKIHRSINENELWLLEPFTKAQAWIDLILHANWKQGSFMVRGNIVCIDRGQIGWSELTISSRWKWSRTKVRRFLSYLEKSGNIIQQKTHITTIITICNYERYQYGDTTDDTTDNTTGDTTEKQQKNNRRYTIEEREEGKEGKESKDCIVKRSAFTVPTKQETATFFQANGSTNEEAGRYWYHYDANGWMAGRVKMKSWTSAAQKWIANSKTIYQNGNGSSTKRNGTLGHQQPVVPEDLHGIAHSIADDTRYA